MTNQIITSQLYERKFVMKSIRLMEPVLAVLILALVVNIALAQASDMFSGEVFTNEGTLTDGEQANLANFDDLDFRVFSGQEWQDLHLSHADDIVVHWPDGRITVGIDVHIEDLAALFVWAPDTRVKQHPVRIAMDNWTAVIGVYCHFV